MESLLKEKQNLRRQISEKQRHCLELQVIAIFSPLKNKTLLYDFVIKQFGNSVKNIK